MTERMTDERLAWLYARDLRTHTDPDLDDIVEEIQLALKAEREYAERVERKYEALVNKLQETEADIRHGWSFSEDPGGPVSRFRKEVADKLRALLKKDDG